MDISHHILGKLRWFFITYKTVITVISNCIVGVWYVLSVSLSFSQDSILRSRGLKSYIRCTLTFLITSFRYEFGVACFPSVLAYWQQLNYDESQQWTSIQYVNMVSFRCLLQFIFLDDDENACLLGKKLTYIIS